MPRKILDQRQQAHRERLVLGRRRALRVGQWIVGLAVLAWGLTMLTREMGPALQGWLEIRDVEVEGIHHVTKPEVLERLVLKPGMGLHQISTSFLAERVQSACLDQGGDGRTQATASAACHHSGTHAGCHYSDGRGPLVER